MSRIQWDSNGERLYETGVKNCVLYVYDAGNYGEGVAWNGITSISENPSGAEPTPLYADDIKYLNLISTEEFSASVEAYTYPLEFAECDGSAELASGIFIGQQPRKTFALCYRTTVGNDMEGDAFGYKLHLIYGCTATPSQKSYQTINNSPEAMTFSWDINTVPVPVEGHKATATLTIDSTRTLPEKLKVIENALYGADADYYSESRTYAVGDYCAYDITNPSSLSNAGTYVCTTAVTTPGPWNSSCWESVDDDTVMDSHILFPDEIFALMVD